ncbi:MAG TPA: hypothetical protein VMM36_19585 [Opitutaceae bacterium]|nr:hypothetical protein [Opitutaceae bacterium]
MSTTLHVWPHPRIESGGFVRESARVEYPGKEACDLWFEVPVEWKSKLSDRHDHFLLAVIFRAMEDADKCHIHGTVTQSLLRNLEEFNAVWRAWDPSRYRSVELIVDTAAPTACRDGLGALLAFSGGVDATASLYRHTAGRLGWRRRDIQAGVLVQGFDISLNEGDAFSRTLTRAAGLMARLGLPVIPVRTNLMGLGCDWEMCFAVHLAACLNLLSGGYGAGLMGSDEPYAFLEVPWGSNPISNPLLGSPQFEIVTDGAELTRLEKVRLLGNWREGVESLRVCWEGPMTGSNCGVCEKCVRTRLELLVCGIEDPSPFESPLLPGHLAKITPRNKLQLRHLRDVLDECEKRDMRAWWVPELRRIVEAGVPKPSVVRALARRIVPPRIRPWLKQLLPVSVR